MFIVDKQIKAAYKKFLEDLKLYEHDQFSVYTTILYFIHSAEYLSIIFLHWTSFNLYERYMLNFQVKCCVPVRCGRFLYAPVIFALQTWDITQDTCGAPGFTSNPFVSELSEATDRQIVNLLPLVGKLMEHIAARRQVVYEIKLTIRKIS